MNDLLQMIRCGLIDQMNFSHDNEGDLHIELRKTGKDEYTLHQIISKKFVDNEVVFGQFVDKIAEKWKRAILKIAEEELEG